MSASAVEQILNVFARGSNLNKKNFCILRGCCLAGCGSISFLCTFLQLQGYCFEQEFPQFLFFFFQLDYCDKSGSTTLYRAVVNASLFSFLVSGLS